MSNFTYTRGIPATNNNPSTDQPNMAVNTNSIDDLIAVDHVSFGQNDGGNHEQITFPSSVSVVVPGAQTDPGASVYRNVGSASSVVELFYKNQNAVLLLSCIKAFGVFTSNSSISVTVLNNSFNVASMSSSGTTYTINLTSSVVTGNNVVVFITTANSSGAVTWSFTNPVLTITYNATGPKVSFVILQY